MPNNETLIRWTAYVNIFAAINTLLFWVGFFTETLFPVDILSQRIAHFEGYYAWESSFVVPDVVLSCVALFAAFKLLRNYRDGLGRLILAACAGGWLFLGVLDFTYGISNGMYFLDHSFSLILLSIGLGLPVLGLVTIWAIYRSNTTESVNSA